MQTILNFLFKTLDLPVDRLIGLIALAGIGLAFFAIYVVFVVVTRRSDK